MAAEAAILGTPAVFVHTARLGYMLELEERYGLLWNTPFQDKATEFAGGVLDDLEEAAETWEAKRTAMLTERIDVGEWLVQQVKAAVG